MNVYLLSGLGADKRVFSKLSFSDEYAINHIAWITPHHNEELADYAKRLSTQIEQSKPFILIGVSFGGMIAVEICGFLKPGKTIIISSASTSDQIPWYYKIAGLLNLHQIVPSKLLKAPTPIAFWFFGARDKEQKNLLSEILKDTDGSFLKWALSKIINWKHQHKPDNLYQIHGSSDKILPITFIKPDLKIINGGHLMVYNQYDIISIALAEQMKSY
jgi:pimeloyl-ACP methyl ester carboxylesterase